MIHVSKDAGENWKDVTPPNAPKYLMWNSVEPDPFTKGDCMLQEHFIKMVILNLTCLKLKTMVKPGLK